MGKTALVLAGGGARAAYQVGVLKALAENYSRTHPVPFEIICGTSAGGINGTALAVHASCFHLGVRKLHWVWSHFRTHQVYRSSFRGAFDHLMNVIFGGRFGRTRRPISLLDNAPLRELLTKFLDFPRIEKNIRRGRLHAVSVDTSSYNSSRSVTFYQGHHAVHDWMRARRRGRRAELGIDHLLATTAIPLVFPSSQIGDSYFADGSIHQMAPLSSSIHLGAEKIFVIHLDSEKSSGRLELASHPEAATIAGHLLDTIFSDTLNSDMERLQRINRTLELIPENKKEESGLKPLDTFVIRPSKDLSEIANQYFNDLPRIVQLLLRLIGIDRSSDSSIVSYLLFEQRYCRALIDLGYQDARNNMTEIRRFLQ